MIPFNISNNDFQGGEYKKFIGGIDTVNKTLYINKIYFSKSFFDNNDIILVLRSYDLDMPLEPGYQANHQLYNEYKEILTINSVDLVYDNGKYYKYEPPIMPCRKLYPTNGQENTHRHQTLTFSFHDSTNINSGIEITDPFRIEFVIDD